MAFFSVIIPAYNCEKYLMDAVESVRRQPVKDIEIIIIDDGSSDSTGQICDRLRESHAENASDGGKTAVWVIHQRNEGPLQLEIQEFARPQESICFSWTQMIHMRIMPLIKDFWKCVKRDMM